jgi:hypothetical protein
MIAQTVTGGHARRLVLLAALLAAILTMLPGCSLAGQPNTVRPGNTPTATPAGPTPLPTPPLGVRPSPVAGMLGPAPTDCAAVAPPATMTVTDFGGGFSGTTTFTGGAPVWTQGLPSGSSPLHLNASGEPTPYPGTKVMWIVGPNYPQPVTLTGHDLRTGMPLWFALYPSNGVSNDNPDALTAYTTHLVLDPAAPNRGSAENSRGDWNIWGVGLVVLAAGCYELDVTWTTGSWRSAFAAGR